MMVQKAYLFGDKPSVEAILNTSDPKKQKALGRKVKGFNNDVKECIIEFKTGNLIINDFFRTKKMSSEMQLKVRLAKIGSLILIQLKAA